MPSTTLALTVLLFCAIGSHAFAQAPAPPAAGSPADQSGPTSPPPTFGGYTPGEGFKLADTEYGDVNFRVFTYLRYLNQRAVDPTYTSAFRTTSDIQQRQDIQFQKLMIYFFGWIMDSKFRYMSYVWTSNTSLGQTSQVVVAGNLTYRFDKRLTIGGGISGLPGVRSTEGNFPHWLSVDSRLITDEYLRPWYTTGIWARGEIAPRVNYQVMLGNNISQFGIDSSQLDNDLSTFSTALVWMPTTGEFGKSGQFGDFDHHDKLATRIGGHFTRSHETRQAQPTTDGFDNVQLRVSDGSVIFSAGLFGSGVQIEEADYHMVAFDGGVKYRGYSVDGEYYRRRLDHFIPRTEQPVPFSELRDQGFSVQASAMLMPKTLQAYFGGSRVFGEYGNPSDWRIGGTIFPWKNEVVRWNVEFLDVTRSPVGAQNLPYAVGMNGPVFHSSVMVWF